MKKLQFLLIAILALNCEAIINASTEDTNTDHNCQELQQILAGLINGTLKNGTQQTDITKNISKEAIFDCTIKHLKTNNRSSFISIVTSTYKDKKETTVNVKVSSDGLGRGIKVSAEGIPVTNNRSSKHRD